MSQRKKPQPDDDGDSGMSHSLITTKRHDSFAPPDREGDSSGPDHRPLGSTKRKMKRFLRAYEQNANNLTATCKLVGVSTRTFYRWTNPDSTNKLHRQFQRQLARIQDGQDLLLDAAEITVAQKIAKGDLTAAMFVINKLGYRRGWSERPELLAQSQQRVSEASISAVRSYQLWLADNPGASESEKSEWLGRFAQTGGVSPDEVRRTMKIQELTASVQ